MTYPIETERLIIRLSDVGIAPATLDYFSRNRSFFENVEAERDDIYYTLDYQKKLMAFEMKKIESGLSAYYYAFLKDDPGRIAASVTFINIRNAPYYSTTFGYDVDEKLQGQGIATETVRASIDDVIKNHNIHRIEARVLPDNDVSIHILEKLGFIYEGIEKSSILLKGSFRDHKRYAYINEAFIY